MRLKKIDINGFKSFGRQANIVFDTPITGVVGPNGSGKSNVVESIRFALGEQSIKSMRGGQSTDFLFKSGTSSRSVARAAVALTFDNSDRVFRLASLGDGSISLDTDEVVISREVYSDGSQKYAINGAGARMRDVVELISSVNIGSSGHHIISQGESDRFLFSSPKERRILLEEALGLKMYHYRIGETERKLEKSRVALREARIMHKELEPHVKFLRKQIEKINQAEALRNDIKAAYNTVLSPLRSVIGVWSASIESATEQNRSTENALHTQLQQLQSQLDTLRTAAPKNTDSELQSVLRSLRDEERAVMRDTSKYELAVEQVKRDISKLQTQLARALEIKEVHQVPLTAVRGTIAELREVLAGDMELSVIIERARAVITEFESTLVSHPDTALVDQLRLDIAEAMSELAQSELRMGEREAQLQAITAKIVEVEMSVRALHQSEIASRAAEFDVERQIATTQQEIQAVMSRTQMIVRESEEVTLLRAQYESDMQECIGLFGPDWVPAEYDNRPSNKPEISVLLQSITASRRQLDRLKIRLEDTGVVSVDDVIREHDETEKRYTLLGSQIEDIERAISELEPLLVQLQSEIRTNFASGVERINKQFGEFFVTMFGGGHAEIVVIDTPKRKKKDTENTESTDEDEESEQGVDIRVKIPNKKQGDLSILSGGERSLTSIALLFSLSQVNPPPFIVLDETDAALDEANSRRYGQLMKKLSSISQILVVTHNRETMGHCQRLYGVTLGADSASQLFSVKFEEAVQYAK